MPSNAAPPATINRPCPSPVYFRPGTTAAPTPPDQAGAPMFALPSNQLRTTGDADQRAAS